jgi:hypothetical protein
MWSKVGGERLKVRIGIIKGNCLRRPIHEGRVKKLKLRLFLEIEGELWFVREVHVDKGGRLKEEIEGGWLLSVCRSS